MSLHLACYGFSRPAIFFPGPCSQNPLVGTTKPPMQDLRKKLSVNTQPGAPHGTAYTENLRNDSSVTSARFPTVGVSTSKYKTIIFFYTSWRGYITQPIILHTVAPCRQRPILYFSICEIFTPSRLKGCVPKMTSELM
jgi:hypothetical protein